MTRSPLIILALAVAGLFVTSLIGVMIWVAYDSPRPGPFRTQFELTDDRGNPVGPSIFHGSPALVYFGYTHCPEVCPTTLYEVADWLKTLGPEGKDLKAYFFSIDPERDTPEVMHGYVTAFTDRITGITGKPEEMKKVVDGWMIHASKLPSEDGDYHMSHTVSLLLVGADGRLKDMIPYGLDKQQAITKIRELLSSGPGAKTAGQQLSDSLILPSPGQRS
ncbi:SCO family protein [Agrobacterium vitis]|uniref:SCO family protein n=1 Tax=Agrobacterium vitis TaxID=373 RepID=A0AAE4WFJ7_AGRVI|nr:SCO family protein [Agrobacterium vitis]MCF1499957.1 SCO family protein [Allorhizobium sp. Av2]MBF2714425.1 SCO family protein [Agrobacterium vitis]MCM2442358.1 SCO family protein [Agrobacterium vitis]MUZ58768.1 SCO family protein [Agrobacterium vitis]MUZ64303.1 SCO family protein [Agrobacterium vitis]